MWRLTLTHQSFQSFGIYIVLLSPVDKAPFAFSCEFRVHAALRAAHRLLLDACVFGPGRPRRCGFEHFIGADSLMAFVNRGQVLLSGTLKVINTETTPSVDDAYLGDGRRMLA